MDENTPETASVNDEKEEDLLWEEFRKTKSSKLRDKFIRQYMPLVKYVAGKVAVGMPNSVEFDDLVGFGQFGLLDAISKSVQGREIQDVCRNTYTGSDFRRASPNRLGTSFGKAEIPRDRGHDCFP